VARPDAEVVRGLAALLADPEDYVREEAAAALGWLGPEAKEALPALEKAMKTTRGIPRLAVAYAIARLDPAHANGLPVLVAALEDKNWEARAQATRDLAHFGAEARKAAAAALIAQLKGPIADLRYEAARTLGQIGPDRPIVEALAKALTDPSPRIVTEAAAALTLARPEDLKPALPALLKLVDDPEPALSAAASLAVLQGDRTHKQARAQLKEYLQVLTNALELSRRFPQNPTSRPGAMHWLSAVEMLGPDAKAALPLVKRIAKDDPDEKVREQAARTLKVVEGSR
jgi:HEAT repeat protein